MSRAARKMREAESPTLPTVVAERDEAEVYPQLAAFGIPPAGRHAEDFDLGAMSVTELLIDAIRPMTADADQRDPILLFEGDAAVLRRRVAAQRELYVRVIEHLTSVRPERARRVEVSP